MLRLFKRAIDKQGRTGVAQDGGRTGLARIKRLDDGKLSLYARVVDSGEAGSVWLNEVAVDAENMNLAKSPVSTVLRNDAYQLQLVEMPNVPADELLAAVRWRIKDLIDYPLDEAVVEVFEMPRHANAGSTPTAYAVIARSADVLTQVELMQQVDLPLDVIDIPELCMRNIAVRLPQDEHGVAFLHFAESCGYLIVTRKSVLHIIRRIDVGRRGLEEAAGDALMLQDRIGGIALEVQRSLDYYESHYDRRPITDLVFGPGKWPDALPDALTENLGLDVSRIALEDLCSMEAELSLEDQGHCLLAVGAAMRTDLPTQPPAAP